MHPIRRTTALEASLLRRLTLGLLLALPGWGATGSALDAQTPSPPQQGPEEILSYDVLVDVQPDGWLEIAEIIRVRANGNEIRRGIYRDFPTRFPGASRFSRVNAPFEVTGVLRDGVAEPYTLLSVGGPAQRGGVRVRIGDPDVLLESGLHTYTLRYRTTRWIQHGPVTDSLTWNVTGHGWAFPIRQASARVLLPERVPAADVRMDGWTGEVGSTARELTSEYVVNGADERSQAVFETTGTLPPGEGLTVRVAMPTELVAAPTEEQRARWFLLDFGPWIDTGLVVALLLAVYLLLWNRVGRDPRGRPVMVRYEPPEDFSPAALGYLVERGYDTRQMAAALVSLAVKGRVRLEQDDDDWVVRGVRYDNGEGPSAEEPLAPEEERVLHELLGQDGTGMERLGGSSNAEVRAAARALRSRLKRHLEARYFVNNRRWFALGVGLSLIGFAALAWRARFSIAPEAWFMGLWLTIWTLGTGTLVVRALIEWKNALTGRLLSWGSALFLTLFSLPFVGAELFVGWMLVQAVPPHIAGAAVVLGGLNVLFYHLLERPTLLGRGVLDQLEGYEAFLTATEGDRIRRLQPADASMELFERHLPYALALGVESAWAERFEDALDAAALAATGRSGGAMAWYHANGGSPTSFSGMSSSLGSAFSSSLSASSAAPSSSGGGSSGGGFSGGGGGGGGGGGW